MKCLGSKQVLAAIAFGLVAFSPIGSSQNLAPKDQAAVVMVGHSLINYDMPVIVERLAISKGLGYARATQVIIGGPLLLNLQYCRGTLTPQEIAEDKFKYACSAMEQGSALGPYDTLVLTDSNGPVHSFPDLHQGIADFIDVLHSRNTSGRVLLFTTWESTNWPGYGSEWPSRQAADLSTWETIAQASTAVSRARGRTVTVEVIPVNTALRDLIYRAESGQIPGITSRNQIFWDDVHMNSVGNYFVACVVFAAIMNRTPEGGASPVQADFANYYNWTNTPTATALALQRLAWEVVTSYRSASAAVLPKAPGSFTVQ